MRNSWRRSPPPAIIDETMASVCLQSEDEIRELHLCEGVIALCELGPPRVLWPFTLSNYNTQWYTRKTHVRFHWYAPHRCLGYQCSRELPIIADNGGAWGARLIVAERGSFARILGWIDLPDLRVIKGKRYILQFGPPDGIFSFAEHSRDVYPTSSAIDEAPEPIQGNVVESHPTRRYFLKGS